MAFLPLRPVPVADNASTLYKEWLGWLSEEVAREAVAKGNSIERYKWRKFWRERVEEAEERIEE